MTDHQGAGGNSAPVLEVRGLVKAFGGVRAVDDVSFAVGAGQTVSIIGPNGSGKTTAFNLISGLLRPDAGEVWFAGRRIDGHSPERIAELGLSRTFQNGRVFGNMTVRENVLVGMHTRLRSARPVARWRHTPGVQWLGLLAELWLAVWRPGGVQREEAALDVEATGRLQLFGDRLLPRSEELAYGLSYANRRRLEVARALAVGPRLLLLDEPSAGMNVTETAEMLHQLKALRRAGQTTLLIEHKLDLVMELSDNVIVMDGGKPIAAGAPAMVQADARVVEAYLGRGRTRLSVDQVAQASVDRLAAGPLQRPIDPDGAGTPAAQPLLRLEDVDAWYGPVQALRGLNLRVDAGEIVCLLGGNASGKSTTMKVILGLLRPGAGRVLVEGADVTHLPTAERIRRGLASVPEARRIFAAMTVEENLRLGAFVRGQADEELERMYGLFPRLSERRRQLGGTLSGGEQQMLAMARALMGRPRLICMDEPTMGLAPAFVERMLDLIQDINRSGVSVLLVEQNATLALSIGHRGYVLDSGVLTLHGPARDLINNAAVREAYLGQRQADAAATSA